MKPLSREFFSRDTLIVAKELLGKFVIRNINGNTICALIVETEAYIGDHDPASHSFGRITERNKVMFGPAGFAYVYFIYGNHNCFNVVTGPKGKGNAVLIRACEITAGEKMAAQFRNYPRSKVELANGPGKLCVALGIDRGFYGHDLTRSSELIIGGNNLIKQDNIICTPRIGISKGSELNYRFIIRDNMFVTKHRLNSITH